MYLARISSGRESIERVDDYEGRYAGGKIVRRLRQARAWRFNGGASALSQSPEGALASARRMLEQPESTYEFQATRERV